MIPSQSAEETQDRISTLMLDFLFEKRFYHEVLSRVNKRYTRDIRKIASSIDKNGVTIHINPDFASKIDDKKFKSYLEHELLHICLRHPLRRTDMDPKTFDTAADLAVNQLMDNPPDEFIKLRNLFSEADMDINREAEYYYTKLKTALGEKDITDEDLKTDDDHDLWENDNEPDNESPMPDMAEFSSQEKENESSLNRIISDSYRSSSGLISSPLLRAIVERIFIKKSGPYRKNWRIILKDEIKKVLHQQSWKSIEIKPSKKRPNKKTGYPFPSLRVMPKQKKNIAVIIDSSGSITDGKLMAGIKNGSAQFVRKFEAFLHELHCLCNEEMNIDLIFSDENIFNPEELNHISVPLDAIPLAEKIESLSSLLDMKSGVIRNYSGKKQVILYDLLNHIIEFNSIEEITQIKGIGGGTSFVNAVRKAEETMPDCIIFFTDGFDDGRLNQPATPLIFVLTGENKSFYKWAKVIGINDLIKDDPFYQQ